MEESDALTVPTLGKASSGKDSRAPISTVERCVGRWSLLKLAVVETPPQGSGHLMDHGVMVIPVPVRESASASEPRQPRGSQVMHAQPCLSPRYASTMSFHGLLAPLVPPLGLCLLLILNLNLNFPSCSLYSSFQILSIVLSQSCRNPSAIRLHGSVRSH